MLRELCVLVLLLPTLVACSLLAVAFVMGASPPDGLLRQPRAAPWDVLTRTEVVDEFGPGPGSHQAQAGRGLADRSLSGAGPPERGEVAPELNVVRRTSGSGPPPRASLRDDEAVAQVERVAGQKIGMAFLHAPLSRSAASAATPRATTAGSARASPEQFARTAGSR